MIRKEKRGEICILEYEKWLKKIIVSLSDDYQMSEEEMANSWKKLVDKLKKIFGRKNEDNG